MTDGRLVAAVPELDTYHPHSGIGRVLHNLALSWGGQVQLARARFEATPLPLLRNVPYRVRGSAGADLVFLPKMTGAGALRDTRGIPSVVIVHDIGIVDYPPDRAAMSWPAVQAVLYSFRGLRHASRIIAVSEFTRSRLVHHLPQVAPRIEVIPNTIAPPFLSFGATKSEARAMLAIAGGANNGGANTGNLRSSIPGALDGVVSAEPLLLFVGSETPRKNIPLMFDVFRAIKDRHPQAQLLKVGLPGGRLWREKTLDLARSRGLQIGRDVHLLQEVSDAILAAAYRAADVFVSTSLYEGYGLPAAEALATGTPVVVTNRGAFPETVGRAGRVAEPEVNAFVRAVDEALGSPTVTERDREGEALPRTMSVSAAAARYLEVFEGVVRTS